MTNPHPAGHALGVGSILVGMGLFLLGRSLDGFLAGLFTGAAVALMLLGVLVISRSWRRDGGWLPSRGDEDGDWLPSRDEADR
ncbi:hypothetical protein [Nocardioides sp. CER19]|uniref:hypothetical protein n=1 Tax=Nocardioides sp. CER19 TaxID=3038538 RepID=UPI00244CC6B8|nr:hypothetical protein [Nocardioides sp. CER19]MDH2413691.1 hypothetical protein [Nocardioides sp. CER19]